MRSQQGYYTETAGSYDRAHLAETEHEIALAALVGFVKYYSLTSVLDVGAGTGRVLRHAGKLLPGVKLSGIEPVAALREVAYQNGISRDQLIEGNALSLPFPDDHWDIVSAFGVMHHIPNPDLALAEMCRVARHGIFISDLNNYGCGSWAQRKFSQTLRAFRLWRPFQYLKNGGKFEKFSEGDGIHYSYSLFDSLTVIRRYFPQIHLMNTRGSHHDLLGRCSHVALLAVKSDEELLARRTPLAAQ